ncbi:hypothetical protein SM124_19180 [Bacillus sp. 31A1R]|uniref:Uncharacterized protein n=1 Tax=Robertmurraya mangrovi TaxID=3098077 RepID=A0ABU5J3A6_9BACI|nr:hypothetical protein [Bacillus sp. 31A1R]MDZ5473846.1 hypothetical protein [Bacillus sp. 31A1R]
MELTFNSNHTEGIHIYLTDNTLQYWLHFTSFQKQWRGMVLSHSKVITKSEKKQLQNEFNLFDDLYMRFLTYLTNDLQAYNNMFLPAKFVQAIENEFDDFIVYCKENNDLDLLEITADFKLIFRRNLITPQNLTH